MNKYRVEDLFQMDDEYVCTLEDKYQRMALEELREEPLIRAQAIAQMRDWIERHPLIKRCRTDSVFLLRFLRTRKFSVPLACETLERYLLSKTLYPEWFGQLDSEEPAIQEILRGGYLIPLPERGEDGRCVILSAAGRFDPHKHTAAQMARTHGVIAELVLDDERNQIAGYTYLNDEGGIQLAHLSMWGIMDIKKMTRVFQHGSPMRHKMSHFLNLPPAALKFIEVATSMLPEKFNTRKKLHKSVEELHDYVEPAILPMEYGGKIPLSEMVDDLLERLREARPRMLALNDMCIEVDTSSALVKDMKSVDEELGLGVQGTFRQLQVD